MRVSIRQLIEMTEARSTLGPTNAQQLSKDAYTPAGFRVASSGDTVTWRAQVTVVGVQYNFNLVVHLGPVSGENQEAQLNWTVQAKAKDGDHERLMRIMASKYLRPRIHRGAHSQSTNVYIITGTEHATSRQNGGIVQAVSDILDDLGETYSRTTMR